MKETLEHLFKQLQTQYEKQNGEVRLYLLDGGIYYPNQIVPTNSQNIIFHLWVQKAYTLWLFVK